MCTCAVGVASACGQAEVNPAVKLVAYEPFQFLTWFADFWVLTLLELGHSHIFKVAPLGCNLVTIVTFDL